MDTEAGADAARALSSLEKGAANYPRSFSAADLNEAKNEMKAILHADAHPHPAYVVGVCVLALAVGYLIYVLMYKPCASGVWVDSNGDVYRLRHNRLTDSICIIVGGSRAEGKVVNNMVLVGDFVGVWDYNSVIMFPSGGGMVRVEK